MVGVYETIERPLIPVLLGMEQAGIKVDAPRSGSCRPSSRSAWRELEERDSTSSPAAPFNLGSPKQLGEVLFDELKLPGGRRNKTGVVGDRRRGAGGPGGAGPCPAGQILE